MCHMQPSLSGPPPPPFSVISFGISTSAMPCSVSAQGQASWGAQRRHCPALTPATPKPVLGQPASVGGAARLARTRPGSRGQAPLQAIRFPISKMGARWVPEPERAVSWGTPSGTGTPLVSGTA